MDPVVAVVNLVFDQDVAFEQVGGELVEALWREAEVESGAAADVTIAAAFAGLIESDEEFAGLLKR